jgi:signal transduction histidine kinase
MMDKVTDELAGQGAGAARRDGLLLEVALQLGATVELETLLPLVVRRVVEVLDAERGMLALVDTEGRVVRTVVHNLPTDLAPENLPVSGTLLRDVVRTGEVIITGDAQADAHLGGQSSVRYHQLRFMVGAPVFGPAGVSAVLYVDSTSPRLVGDDGVQQTLVALTRLVGTALENARLFDEQSLRAEVLAQTVHDFRAPLGVVLVNAGLALREAEPGSESERMAQDILAGAERMRRMIELTLALVRTDAHRPTRVAEPETLDVRAYLGQYTQTMATLASEFSVRLSATVDVEAPGPVELDVADDGLLLILDNLVFNAFRYARPGSAVEVGARLRDDRGPAEVLARSDGSGRGFFRRAVPRLPDTGTRFVEFRVCNEGAGIPESRTPALLQPFSGETERRGSFRSTGIGLVVVDQCARHMGGAVWLDETAPEGITRFCFTLPQRAHFAEWT